MRGGYVSKRERQELEAWWEERKRSRGIVKWKPTGKLVRRIVQGDEMARPKFRPNETPIENYQNNLINWSMITFKYASPIGPEQKQYDPYYMYTVIADVGGQYAECAWFVNVDEHKIIQKAGATQNSVMAATFVMEGKRRSLIIVHSSGPVLQRTDEQVEQETAEALAKLQNGGVMLGPPPPTVPAPPQSAVPQVPQVPSKPQAQQIPQAPAPQAPKPPAPTPAPPPSAPEQYIEQKVYTPMSDVEMDAFKAYWRDIARLHIWAYYELPEVVKELGLPKVKPTDQREMSTSINIETWRQMGRGRSPLPGWIVRERPAPPPDPTTKNGALQAIDTLQPGAEENAAYFIKRWLNMVIAPADNLDNWQHAANIAKLLGLDGQVLFNEHDSDHLMMLTQAIWTYADARDEGLTRNEALLAVSEEFGLPKELMQFEEIVEDDEEYEEFDEEPAF